MRLVTTDPHTYVMSNVAGHGMAAIVYVMFVMLPLGPAIYPLFTTVSLFAHLMRSAGIQVLHPLFQILILAGFCFGLWRAWRYALATLPIKVAAMHTMLRTGELFERSVAAEA